MDNIYCSPEKFGLEVVETINISTGYDFDIWVVWRRINDGKLFCGHDSGCSCPTPFDEWTLDSTDSIEEHIVKVKEEIAETWKYSGDIAELKEYLREIEKLR